VYKMLEDPGNMYGLPEDEFIVFLRDTSTFNYKHLFIYYLFIHINLLVFHHT